MYCFKRLSAFVIRSTHEQLSIQQCEGLPLFVQLSEHLAHSRRTSEVYRGVRGGRVGGGGWGGGGGEELQRQPWHRNI